MGGRWLRGGDGVSGLGGDEMGKVLGTYWSVEEELVLVELMGVLMFVRR